MGRCWVASRRPVLCCLGKCAVCFSVFARSDTEVTWGCFMDCTATLTPRLRNRNESWARMVSFGAFREDCAGRDPGRFGGSGGSWRRFDVEGAVCSRLK